MKPPWSVSNNAQPGHPAEVLDVVRDERRIIDERGGGDEQIHGGEGAARALDRGENAGVRRREPLVGIRDHQAGDQPVQSLMFLKRIPGELGARAKLAYDVDGHGKRLVVFERLERVEGTPRLVAGHLPVQVDEQAGVQVNHSLMARAGLAVLRFT